MLDSWITSLMFSKDSVFILTSLAIVFLYCIQSYSFTNLWKFSISGASAFVNSFPTSLYLCKGCFLSKKARIIYSIAVNEICGILTPIKTRWLKTDFIFKTSALGLWVVCFSIRLWLSELISKQWVQALILTTNCGHLTRLWKNSSQIRVHLLPVNKQKKWK